MEIAQDDIERLRKTVEAKMGRRILTNSDFGMLTERIYEQLKVNISPTTLKRLWGI